MNPAVLSSFAAGLFLALAAFGLRNYTALFMLAVCAVFAYISHDEGLPVMVRLLAHYVGLVFGIFIFVYVYINS